MLDEKSYQKIHDIATLSSVKRELIDISSDITNNSDRIIDFIIYDPALTLTVLRTVNSAFFGFPRFIKTIPQAVNIIGTERVLHIALSTTELVRHQEETNIKGLTIRSLWEHSIATAIAASEIAKKVYTNIEDEVFVCGLLHDIGKIGLIQHNKEYIKKVVSLTRLDHSLFIECEHELSVFDHAIIGAQVVKEWSLPEMIKFAIKYHHKPFES
ncbi:MAG: HDOD domain-containing protein, partial [Planctomycetes bacterium]|nr:HDOD domain-containing protein [Planctomycetota bacterium]